MAITGSATITIGKTLSSITISPTNVTLNPGNTQQFTATGHYNDASTAPASVTWSANGGTITSGGLYTAGSTPGGYTVTATSTVNGSLHATASVTVPSQTPSPVVFEGGFETGNLSQYSGRGGLDPAYTYDNAAVVQSCCCDRVLVYTAASQPTWPAPRYGTHACRFRVTNNDHSSATGGCGTWGGTENPRAQTLSPTFMPFESEWWTAFSFYLPTNFPPWGNGFFFLYSVYGNPGGGTGWLNLPLAGSTTTGDIWYSMRGSTWTKPIRRGAWEDFIFHFYLSKDPTKGWQELWYNGVQQPLGPNGALRVTKQTVNLETTSKMDSGLRSYRKFAGGINPNVTWPDVVDVYFDWHRVGKTKASVEQPA